MIITHKDKILFPKDSITKEKLAEYYDRIAKKMLPFLKNRFLSLKRFPKGVGFPGFFQKNAPKSLPAWIKTVQVKTKTGKTLSMIVCQNKKTLLWLVNQNCIEFHIGLSKISQPNFPDKMVFDLDPPTEKDFSLAVQCAFQIKAMIKTTSLVMTTGSKGLHVVIPLKKKNSFLEVRNLAKKMAKQLVQMHPDLWTLETRKNKREGKMYIDVSRNSLGQTTIAPYSVRAQDKAPIAMPISWEDLEKKRVTRSTFFDLRQM